ncbi:hypothetical protein [Rothia nasimurium]|uniref:hypothetical protein n=1 Tax=Rothia nasimurium TaxID=85336 RepID=UPI001F35088D|nr:hypothetical protein [Rothia nasimurium]
MKTLTTALHKIAGITLTAATACVLTLATAGPATAETTPSVTVETVSSNLPLTEVFDDSVQLNRVSVDTQLGLTGSVNQTWEFTVDTDQANATNGELQNYLSPDPSVGTITSAENAGQTTYTVTLSGSDSIDFNTKLGSYIPGAYFQLETPNGFYIWPGYNVRMYLPVTDSKLAGGVNGTYTYNLKLPFLNSFDASSQSLVAQGVVVSGNTVSGTQSNLQGTDVTSHIYLAAAGPNLVSLIVLVVLLLVLIALALLAIRHREKIKERSQKIWSRRDKVIAATSTGVGAASAAARTGVGAATVAARQAGSSIRTMGEDFQRTNQTLLGTEAQAPAPGQPAVGSVAAPQVVVDANPTVPLTYPQAYPAAGQVPGQAQNPVATPQQVQQPTQPQPPVQPTQPQYAQPQPYPGVQPSPGVQQAAQPQTYAQQQFLGQPVPGTQPVEAQQQAAYPYGVAPQAQTQQAPARQITPELAAWQQSFSEHYMQ